MGHETILNRLRNIKELSEDKGATEAEKQSALNKLDQLLEKYNLTLDDLESVERKEYQFAYKRKWERKLLVQIIAHVLERGDFSYWTYRSRSTGRKLQEIGLELTKAEYEQINRLYTVYKKQFIDELELLMDAFIDRHNIYAPSSGLDIDLTNIDWLRVKRMQELSKQLEVLPSANLQLTDSTEDKV